MKHESLLRRLSLLEKAALLSGRSEWASREIPRLGIPAVFFSDGPSGLRKQAGTGDHLGLNPSVPATCFPGSACLAASWDPELLQAVGQGLGREAAAEQVDVLLAPGLNIKRNPLCGRNFEYFSEDPYLSGKLAAAVIRGIQSTGTAACPKHFAVNSQENRRMTVNVVIDERTLREIYLTGFEIAVKEGHPRVIMASYNMVNGTYAAENRHLLTDILRKEWGFDGVVVTDWGGSADHAAGVKNGCTLEMPAPGLSSAWELLKALKEGRITRREIDARADEMLDLALRQGHRKGLLQSIFGNAAAEKQRKKNMFRQNHRLARRAAAESAVLLKNTDGILPLKPGAGIAVIGDFAFRPRYQGAGSSRVNALRVESIGRILKEYEFRIIGMEQGYRRDGTADPVMLRRAVDLAGHAETVLFCFGLDERSESEGRDRTHMGIPENQVRLMEALAAVNPKIVGILMAGAAVEMPWCGSLEALLLMGLSGQAGAQAAADILTGRVNPSGHLSETIPLKYEDTPAYRYCVPGKRNAEYRDGLYVGYRYYGTAGKPVLFPFGFGLSYTEFSFLDLQVTEKNVSFTVTNTGAAGGAFTAQLYIGKEDPQVFRPAKELKGFRKQYLKAGESTEVSIPFDDKTFRYYNIRADRWETEDGIYRVMIGQNAAEILLEGTAEIVRGRVRGAGEGASAAESAAEETKTCHGKEAGKKTCTREELPSYYTGNITAVSDKEYEALLGRPVPEEPEGFTLTENDALSRMKYSRSRIARLICRRLEQKLAEAEEKGIPDLNADFLYSMPFRALSKMTGGAVSTDMVRGLLLIANGELREGLGKVLNGYVANRVIRKLYEEKLK